MAFRDPFAAYNAANNFEAHMVCAALIDAGIEATVIEDNTQIGTWVGGFVAEIHKPQVWIERADIERAKPVLDEFEFRAAERNAANDLAAEKGEPVDVLCEECGKQSKFPSVQRGSTQRCPHCRAYVDVGEIVDIEGWDVPPEEETEE